MKRLIFLLLFISLTVSLSSQITPISSSVSYAQPSASSYSAAMQAVLTEWTYQPGADTIAQYDIWLTALLDTADFDLLYFYAVTVNTNDEAWVNWITPGTYTMTDPGTTAPAWAAKQGFTFTGDDYLSTNYIPNSHAVNVTENSMSMAVYLRAATITENSRPIGAANVSPSRYMRFYTKQGAGDMVGNMSTSTALTTTNSTSQGLAFPTRTASNAVANYMNGTSLGTATTAPSGNGLPQVAIWVGCYNLDGVATTFINNEMAVAMVLQGASQQVVTEINRATEVLMDYLGTGVQ